MAGKGRQSFEKRQREADRQDRAREKAARRQERKEASDETPVVSDEDALMAAYGRLAERHAAGDVDDDTFAASKQEIFEKLGLDAG